MRNIRSNRMFLSFFFYLLATMISLNHAQIIENPQERLDKKQINT